MKLSTPRYKVQSIEKTIFWDIDFILININALLILIGYGMAIHSGSESVATMKVVKSFFMLISAIGLLKSINLNNRVFKTPSFIYVLVFSFWVLLMSFFTVNVGFSISRATGFLAPFIYVYIAMHNLLNKYNVINLLKAFIKTMNIIYFIPVISYFVSGLGFGEIDIYGQGGQEGHFFVSNHYGWACSIFILTSIDIWLNNKPGKSYKIFLFSFALVAIYITIISGNRASWLSLLFALLILIVRIKTIRTDYKIFLSLIPTIAIIFFSQIPDSSLNTRIEDTELQFKEGEARFQTAELAIRQFEENKVLWLTGAGMFNYESIINSGGLGDYHNSYFEVLFGGGIILFLLFINFMVIRPVYNYAKYYSKYFIVLPPLLIIPFFESNLTGGQFLFFPWFIFMLLFNISPPQKQQQLKPRPKQAYSI